MDEITRLRAELRDSRREVQHLRIENEILRDAAEPLIHRAPARERFVFIRAHRDCFSIRRLCRVLVSDHSNYRAWVRAQEVRDRRRYDDRELTRWIVEIHAARPPYGAVRISRELRRRGVEVGRRRVARLVREQGIAGITRRRRRNLTKPDKEPVPGPQSRATALAVPVGAITARNS